LKKYLPFVIIFFIVVASALRTYYWSGGDDLVEESEPIAVQKPLKPLDLQFKHRIDSFMKKMPPRWGTTGILFYDVDAHYPLYAYNDTTMLRPASCTKLLTAIGAMRILGTNYQYRTRLYTSGVMKGDTLVGNITFKAGLDPFFDQDSLRILTSALKNTGIKVLKGKVVIDIPFMRSMQHEEHWVIGDLKVQKLGLLYSGYRKIRNEVSYAINVAGVKLNGSEVEFGRLNVGNSKKIAEIRTSIHRPVERALKNSSNINAESMLYPLGYTVDKNGDIRKNGLVALRRFIKREMHYPDSLMPVVDDGCGLCPNNRMSPRFLCDLLIYAHEHPKIYKEVYECMSVAGVDGTLGTRMHKLHLRGQIHAKTGTMSRDSGTSTLAGYMRDANGHLLVFAIMNHDCPVYDGRKWQDWFIDAIRKPLPPTEKFVVPAPPVTKVVDKPKKGKSDKKAEKKTNKKKKDKKVSKKNKKKDKKAKKKDKKKKKK
jgi:D-alanyl-D-alanine carboxypeptidase/D-alanyl-D-alanine-endopeptidase (penicillin-binding protein 4)